MDLACQPLVSIVTPCYNGEKTITTFFDSLLKQTYDNVEIYLINDGSTDRTKEICLEYAKLLKKRGYQFYYIEQENAGQAAALNKGLKLFKGKYLTWPDSDDYLCPEYIEKKVQFLEEHKELNMVINPIKHVKANDLNTVIFIESRKFGKGDNLFTDFLEGKNSYYPPGGYMITSESFLKAYPDRTINESRVGQNIQMLLPIAYMHKYGQLNEILYYYIIYPNSHAHKERTFEETVKKGDDSIQLMKDVMSNIPMSKNELNIYNNMLEHEKWRRHFYFAIKFKNRKYMNEAYKKHKATGPVSFRDKLLHIVRNFIWK